MEQFFAEAKMGVRLAAHFPNGTHLHFANAGHQVCQQGAILPLLLGVQLI